MAVTIQEHQVTPDQAGRVDRVIQTLTGRSRSQIRGLIQRGHVKINNAPCTSDFTTVAAGDVVRVSHDPTQNYPARPEAPVGQPFRILFEDPHLLVVEKAAHLLTVPTLKHEQTTLVHHLQKYVSLGCRRLGRVEVVHRLDRGVSGVLVFAKSREVAEKLREQFAEHKPEREYLALVAGVMASDRGTYDKNLVTDAKSIHRRATTRGGAGENAVTHFEVVRRFAHATLVRVRLETGRRNQIRVHFADAGHPVLGDPRYGRSELMRKVNWRHKRIALHAISLGFTHPISQRPVRCEAPLPDEMANYH